MSVEVSSLETNSRKKLDIEPSCSFWILIPEIDDPEFWHQFRFLSAYAIFNFKHHNIDSDWQRLDGALTASLSANENEAL